MTPSSPASSRRAASARRAAGWLLAACATSALASVGTPSVAIIDPPPDHHFGQIPVGATYAAQNFTLFNSTAQTVALGRVEIGSQLATCAALGCPVVAPADFTIQRELDSCSNARLAPNSGCTVLVGFVPSAVGTRIALLGVPVEGQSPVTRVLTGAGSTPPLDCVLDWAQRQYPQALVQPTATFRLDAFHLRCYAGNKVCIGADNAVPTFDRPSLYLYMQDPVPSVQNLGYLTTWASQAQCR